MQADLDCAADDRVGEVAVQGLRGLTARTPSHVQDSRHEPLQRSTSPLAARMHNKSRDDVVDSEACPIKSKAPRLRGLQKFRG
jgi:hypothetical protein